MKYNLKNRPLFEFHPHDAKISENLHEWFEGFEKELREKAAHLEAVLKKNPDNFYAQWKLNGIKEILGE